MSDEKQEDVKGTLDKLSGLTTAEGRTNYLKEFVFSNFSGYTLLIAIIAGALLFAVFGTLGMFLVPPLVAFGIESVLALFLPDHPVFRDRVDRKKAAERRERLRSHYLGKIEQLDPNMRENGVPRSEYRSYQQAYQRMIERLNALREMADDSNNALTTRDIEKLDETTVDFLRLLYSRLMLRERASTSADDIEGQIREIDGEIALADPRDIPRLERVKNDLTRILANRARLPARETTMRAQLLAMGEAFEDLFHRINADPSGGVSEYLDEMSSRLAIEEAVSVEVDELSQARARIAQKAKARARQGEAS